MQEESEDMKKEVQKGGDHRDSGQTLGKHACPMNKSCFGPERPQSKGSSLTSRHIANIPPWEDLSESPGPPGEIRREAKRSGGGARSRGFVRLLGEPVKKRGGKKSVWVLKILGFLCVLGGCY